MDNNDLMEVAILFEFEDEFLDDGPSRTNVNNMSGHGRVGLALTITYPAGVTGHILVYDGGISIATFEADGTGTYSGMHSLKAKNYNIKLQTMSGGVPVSVGNGTLAISN